MVLTQKAHTWELAAIRQMSWGIGSHNGRIGREVWGSRYWDSEEQAAYSTQTCMWFMWCWSTFISLSPNIQVHTTLLIHNVIRQMPHLASHPQTSAWTILTPSTSSTTLLNAAAMPAVTLQWKIYLKVTWSQLSNLWPSHLDSTNVTDKGKYPDLMDFDLSSLLP